MLWCMWPPREMRCRNRVRSVLRAAERALLGRGAPHVHDALDEAIALCGGGVWCDRCGAGLPATARGVRALVGARAEPSDGTSVVRCVACGDAGAFDGFVRLGRYEPPLNRLVRRTKRRAMHAMAHQIGVRLGVELRSRLGEPQDGWVVVPTPAHLGRRLARGIDHAHEISSGLAATVNATVVRALRMRATARQAGLDREARLGRAPRLALRARAARSLAGRSVVLVDDIRTTGATLNEARELLSAAGVKRLVGAVACVTERSQDHT